MKLHVYNPEHDICLARNDPRLPLPRAALLMRKLYGHVPAYWADDGDMVVVDNAENALSRLRAGGRAYAGVRFIGMEELSALAAPELPCEVVPWGWDRNIVAELVGANPLLAGLMPDKQRMENIRRLSSRVFAATEFLPRLLPACAGLTGEMAVFSGTVECLARIVSSRGAVVLKSPWSCSGRGVRMATGALSENDKGWCRRVLREQGAVMVEPYYDKTADFAMEFDADKRYGVRYLGMSVFFAVNGKYQNNVVDSEENKLRIAERYIPRSTLRRVRDRIVETATSLFGDSYCGPFGVDMMAVKTGEGTALHPCVEVNLRRTMGHAALPRRV